MRGPQRFSILWLITGATLLPLLVLGTSLLWLTTRSAQRTSEALGRQVLNEASYRVELSTQYYLERAGRVSTALSTLLEEDAIDAADIDVWRMRLFAHMFVNPEISSIQFVNARLESTYLSRTGDALEYGIARLDPARPDEQPRLTTYNATIDGTLDPASARYRDNNPRLRPWYVKAMSSQTPVWTLPYRWMLSNTPIDQGEWSVAYTRAISSQSGTHLGVLSIDLSFSQLSTYLARIAKPLGARLQIRSDTGQPLARSHPAQPGVHDPVEAALDAWVGPTPRAAEESVGQLVFEGETYLVRETSLDVAPDEQWKLVVAIPEDPVLAAARADLRRMKVISLLSVLATAAVSLWIARLVSRPIRRLAAFATRVGEGDFDQRIAARSTREVDQLSAALNRMAAGLKERVTLLAARDAAIESSAAKARLIAHVSHEFRTPLNAVINYAEMLRDASNAARREQDAKDAGNILIASQHLLTLINNLLDLSRAEAGKLRTEVTRFTLAELLHEVEVTVRPGIERNGNRFVIDDPPRADIESDAARIKQILINVLNNAGKFTQAGEVRIKCEVDDHDVHFIVTDTGRGVDAANLHRIFEPFTQVESSDRSTREGAGLGLAITRQLVQILEGTCTLESQPGLGTTVHIRLPRHLQDTATRSGHVVTGHREPNDSPPAFEARE
jgi:signal transduction histidine kinase